MTEHYTGRDVGFNVEQSSNNNNNNRSSTTTRSPEQQESSHLSLHSLDQNTNENLSGLDIGLGGYHKHDEAHASIDMKTATTLGPQHDNDGVLFSAMYSPIAKPPQNQEGKEEQPHYEEEQQQDQPLLHNNSDKSSSENDAIQQCERAAAEMRQCLAMFGVTSLEHLTQQEPENEQEAEKKQQEEEIIFETTTSGDDNDGQENAWEFQETFTNSTLSPSAMTLMNAPAMSRFAGAMESKEIDGSTKEGEQAESSFVGLAQGHEMERNVTGLDAAHIEDDLLKESQREFSKSVERSMRFEGDGSNSIASNASKRRLSDRRPSDQLQIPAFGDYLLDPESELPNLNFPDDLDDDIPMISFQLPEELQHNNKSDPNQLYGKSPGVTSDGASVMSGSTFTASTYNNAMWHDAQAPPSPSSASIGQLSVDKLRSELLRSSAMTETTTSTSSYPYQHEDQYEQGRSSLEDDSMSFTENGEDDASYCSFQTALTQQQEVDQVVRMAEWMKQSLHSLVDDDDEVNNNTSDSDDDGSYDVHSKPISLEEQLARLEKRPQSESRAKKSPMSLDEHFAREQSASRAKRKNGGKSRPSLGDHFARMDNKPSSPSEPKSLAERLAALEDPPNIKRTTKEEHIERSSSPSPSPDRLSFQDALQVALKMIMKRLFHKAYVYACLIIPIEWWGYWVWWYNLFQQCFPRRRGKSNWDRRLFAQAIALLVLTITIGVAWRCYFGTKHSLTLSVSLGKANDVATFEDDSHLQTSFTYSQETALLTGKLLEDADYNVHI